MTNQLEKNKKNAISFYDLMFNQCKPEEAIEQYVGDVYIQHNPEVADGKQAFIEYFQRMATRCFRPMPKNNYLSKERELDTLDRY